MSANRVGELVEAITSDGWNLHIQPLPDQRGTEWAWVASAHLPLDDTDGVTVYAPAVLSEGGIHTTSAYGSTLVEALTECCAIVAVQPKRAAS